MTKAEVNRETTIADACNAIARLETENAELEKRCANYEMKISKMEKGTCDVCKETEKDKKIVELETRCNELFLQTCEQAEKIKELKSEIENDRDLPAIAYMQGAEKQKKKDEEELKKWKDEWQEQVQKATDEGYARTLQTMQLTKAIEIIKKYLAIGVGGKITQNYLDVTKEAEQFLNGEADESKN